MADIRCPMCGKDNPEDREVCQYCDARLKPLVIDSSDEEYGSGEMEQPLDSSAEEDQETPDWLKSLRDQDEEPPADQSTDLPQAEWLIPARETRRLNTGEIEMEDLGDESWLDSFRSDEGDQDESGEEAAEIAEGSEEGEPQEFQEEIPENHLDDWLAAGDFATRTLDSEEESEPLLEGEGQESEPEAPPAEEEPEWLSRVRSRAQEDMPAEESLDDITSEGEEFLRSLGSQDAGQTLGLSFESGEADSDAVPQQDADLEEQSSETPSGESSSWLSKFGIDENDQGEVQEQEEPDEGVEVPSVEAFDMLFDEETEVSAEDEEDLSWLSELEQQASPGEQALTPESELPGIEAQDAEYPEWLSGLAEGGLDVEAEVEPLEGDTEAEKPDWLMPTTEKGEADEGLGVFDLEAEEEQSFDWLADASEEELPPSDTLPSFEPGTDEAAPEGAVSPFEGEEADWSLEEVEESLERGDSESVVPAELPNWLEAMRPVEAAAVVPPPPEESTREPESSGPLAGLHGIIPAGPSFSRSGEPSGYSVKLQVGETQLAYAKSLEAMIESEGVPERAQKKTGLTSQNILRIIVFVVLIAAVGWPIFTASHQSPLPVSYPGTSDAQRVIGGLGESPSVMVAVDYQPAISGEMETAAEPVIDHLMIKGAYFTMVSTHPGGAVQAERLVRLVNDRHNHFYESIDHYAVLGYIPGGTAGLAAFSQSARQAVPYALNNTDAGSVWDRPLLQGLSRPDDFDLIVVITENAETARAWVEQVGSELSDTPMLMVASAQAAPMIMPYYESNANQLDGIVIGLPGAGAYESSLPRQNPIRDYWDAFGYGISAAILIVLAGGVYNLVMEVIARQRQSKEAG